MVIDSILISIARILADSPILTLFLVIGLGYLLGQISFFGFRLGVAGVLFSGLAVGSLSPNISLPDVISSLGLIIFVYTMGIETGPAFWRSFRTQGFRHTVVCAIVLTFAFAVTFAVGAALHLAKPRTAGLYAGALTNTPALAAVRERLRDRGRAQHLSEDRIRELSSEPVVAYSISYPLGVIGVLLCFQLARRFWFCDSQPTREQAEIHVRNFVVRNGEVAGCTVGELMQMHQSPGFVISRIQHAGNMNLAQPETVLSEGDVVVVVGDNESSERARRIFGEPIDVHLEEDRSQLDFRRVFVSNKEVVGRPMGKLNLDRLSATITRVRRGDVDVVPDPETRLEFGDRIRVLTRRENFPAISKLFGDSIRGTAETDFGSVALGMVLGVMAGMLPIPLPGGTTVRLGLAGGPLLVALILGRVERTGSIAWVMPISANLTLRQIGLLLFLAGVGTKAGFAFVQTMRSDGAQMLAAGALITFSTTLLALLVGYKFLRIPLDSMLGFVSGLQTQPACLAFASNLTKSENTNIAYAGILPIAMIVKIILAQLLV